MATALEIIKGALRRITSYQSGETISAPDIDDCLETLNDLLDSWSTQQTHVIGTVETVFNWFPGKNQYKIGNPLCTEVGSPPFSGSINNGSSIITGVTNIPSDLVVGATLTDSQNVIPAGSTVTSIGVNSVSFGPGTASATSNGADSVSYTIPGDFAMPRPLRITGGFTRFNSLDFWLDVYATQEEYTSILYKAQPGPWPIIAWYNNGYPYGLFNVYQTPGNSAELHLFTDSIMQNLTASTVIQLPQGYSRALKWCLARELWTEYMGVADVPPMLEKLAAESLSAIKALNATPAVRSTYDIELTSRNGRDGGWIFHGGYR